MNNPRKSISGNTRPFFLHCPVLIGSIQREETEKNIYLLKYCMAGPLGTFIGSKQRETDLTSAKAMTALPERALRQREMPRTWKHIFV
jgi:hypothetical protein